MKGILKVFFLLVGVFSTSFILNLHFQWITVESVRETLEALRASPHAALWIALVVIAVLSIDSVLAVPTITTIVLAGYFLGPVQGGTSASIGILIAGSICFWGSRLGGERFLRKIVAEDEARRLRVWFENSGGLALLLSRALPMLPEVLSCLAGMSGMKAARYYLLFALGNVPFAFLAAYAGSRSSLDKPWPALVVGMGVPAVAYLIWFLLGRRRTEVATPEIVEREIELRLEISGIDPRRPGRLHVYLFGPDGFPKDHGAALQKEVLAVQGEVASYRVSTRLAGSVAIKIVHDEEDRGGMRKRFRWIPDFGIGYTNGARITYRVPTFDDAALRLDADVEQLRVPVRMQYLLAPAGTSRDVTTGAVVPDGSGV